MPLVLEAEDPSRGGVGFDLQSSSTLFWKPVPVLLRQADREDCHEDLTFRILTGFARQNHNLRVGVGVGCAARHAGPPALHGSASHN